MDPSGFIDERNHVAHLELGAHINVQLAKNPRHLSLDRRLHAISFKNHDRVAFSNHLTLVDQHTADHGWGRGADFVHGEERSCTVPINLRVIVRLTQVR